MLMIVMGGSLTDLYPPIGRVVAVITASFLDQSGHMQIWMMCLGIKAFANLRLV
jgi:membrane protein DedA with SNARE-associated domain